MEKKYSIDTGIGLQDVDGLKNSSLFLEESQKYIKGEISLSDLEEHISSYYENKPEEEDDSIEADTVAIRIAKLLSDNAFDFSVEQFYRIHRILFSDLLEHAGEIRTYNISKKEWVLDGDSVIYDDYRAVDDDLVYYFRLEKHFSYLGVPPDQIIKHLSEFITSIWKVHAFEEGNTRTVAVFFIKYLTSLGFNVTNDTFKNNSWYFRNALVRASYNNLPKGIVKDDSYLNLFLQNLIFNEKNELHNRDLHVKSSIIVAKTNNERIIKLMEENPKSKVEEIAKQIGVSQRTVKTLLAILQKEKIIKRIDGKRFGYWKINK